MLPAAAAWSCGKQHQAYTEVYVTSVDSAVGAGSRGTVISQGAIWLNPHGMNEDLGKSFETTVERSNWGIIRSCQLGLEENHYHLVSVEWM
jgi:hypothetical protein